jgi:hypothetical protein
MDEKQEQVGQETATEETRHERIAARRRARGGGSPWVVGLVLVAVGVVFLLQNTTGFYLNNWWALFILIPAFSAFGNAVKAYQDSGSFNASARSSMIGGIVLTGIAAVFLFNLDLVLFGPLMLIIGGAALLLSSLAK